MELLNEALSIMLVGMITVFFILFLIVIIGNLIIQFSNKFLLEEIAESKPTRVAEPSNNTYAAIAAAIDIVTKGKGKSTNITKL